MLAVATAFLTAWILFGGPSTPLDLAFAFMFGFGQGWAVVALGRLLAASIIFVLSRGLFPEMADEAARLMPFARWIGAVQAATRELPWQASSMLRLTYIPSAIPNYGLALLPAARMPAAAFFIPMLVFEPLSAFIPACFGAFAPSVAFALQTMPLAVVVVAVPFVGAALALAHLSADILLHQAGHCERQSGVMLGRPVGKEEAGWHGEHVDQGYPYCAV